MNGIISPTLMKILQDPEKRNKLGKGLAYNTPVDIEVGGVTHTFFTNRSNHMTTEHDGIDVDAELGYLYEKLNARKEANRAYIFPDEFLRLIILMKRIREERQSWIELFGNMRSTTPDEKEAMKSYVARHFHKQDGIVLKGISKDEAREMLETIETMRFEFIDEEDIGEDEKNSLHKFFAAFREAVGTEGK